MTDILPAHEWFFKPNTPPDVFARNCLDYAKDIRCDIDLDFKHKMNVVYQAKTICVGMSSTVLRLFMRHQFSYQPYQGMPVNGYFTLRIQNKNYPCHFESVVLQTINRNDSIMVDLRLPQGIKHQQRRSNVRIPIKRNDIQNHKLWTHTTDVSNFQQGTDVDWQPVTPNFYEIIDLSAGGTLITVPNNCPLFESITEGSLFFSTGTFHEGNKKKYNLAAVAIVLRKFETSSDQWYSFATRFVRWALRTESSYSWQTIDPDEGIPALAQWIFYLNGQRKKMINID